MQRMRIYVGGERFDVEGEAELLALILTLAVQAA